jgi:predicted ATP-grasp superfamily ATP-dependent carboligase
VRRALLLSAESPSACAVVRALHGAGFEVSALAESRLSPAGLSWRCQRADVVGEWDGERLLARLAEAAPDLVVPVTEGDLARLAPVRDAVERLSPVLAPPQRVLDLATDKVAGLAAAAEAGACVPEQWVLGCDGDGDHDDDAESVPVDAFPVVAKPSRSRVLDGDGRVHAGTAVYVIDRAALGRLRHVHAAAGVSTIVQRPLPGVGMGASVLLDPDGGRRLSFVHRRIRELRPEGGPSACAVSAPPRADLLEPAVAAARHLGLLGVPVQFEFRVPDEGAPVLLDINPRPWGTLGLALASGVDFYGVAARARLGDDWPAASDVYRVGTRRHVLSFELRRAWTVVYGTPQSGFPGPWPSRGAALFDWIVPPWQGLVGTPDDPLPSCGDALRLLWKALSGP